MGKKAVSLLFNYFSIVTTIFLAIITLLGALASYIDPTNHGYMYFIGLSLPFLIGANIVVVIYWAIRWKYWVWIPVFAIFANIEYLHRKIILFSHAEKAVHTMKLATYNIGGLKRIDLDYSYKKIRDFMKKEKVDVICFQELQSTDEFTEDSVKKYFAEWKYQYIPHDPKIKILQVALFSKFPIVNSRLMTYPDSKNSTMWCDLKIENQIYRVVNNHLQTTSVNQNKDLLHANSLHYRIKMSKMDVFKQMYSDLHKNVVKRVYQAKKVRQLVDSTSHPIILCGDFNSIPSSYTYRKIKGTKLKDGFQAAGIGYMATFRSHNIFRIDYIFCSDTLKAVDYDSRHLDLSDHNPVIMEVGCPETPRE